MIKESIPELRNICQKKSEGRQEPIYDRVIARRISIVITRYFLAFGISANQATVISLIVALIAGVFFISPSALFWLIGLLIFFLFYVLDCVDGEISRYRQSSSPGGTNLDGIVGLFTYSYLLACMAFGIYFSLNGLAALIFGFGAVLTNFLADTSSILQQSVYYEWKIQSAVFKTTELGRNRGVIGLAFTVYKMIFSPPGLRYMPAFLLAAILDSLIAPFGVWGQSLNFRLIWLIVWTMATLAALIVKTYYVVRNGRTINGQS